MKMEASSSPVSGRGGVTPSPLGSTGLPFSGGVGTRRGEGRCGVGGCPVGQIPESGDESQGITVKGLSATIPRLRHRAGNDLAPACRTGTLPRQPTPDTVCPGARDCSIYS